MGRCERMDDNEVKVLVERRIKRTDGSKKKKRRLINLRRKQNGDRRWGLAFKAGANWAAAGTKVASVTGHFFGV